MSKNSGFLKDSFASRVGPRLATSALVLTTMLAPLGGKLAPIFGGTAHAQDSAHAATLPPDFNVIPTSQVPLEKRAKTYSRKEAYDLSEKQIVFHYSPDIDGVDQIAEILNAKNYSAVALPGGPNEMRVGKSQAIKFTQHDVDNGALGGLAIDLFQQKLGPPSPAGEKFSLAK